LGTLLQLAGEVKAPIVGYLAFVTKALDLVAGCGRNPGIVDVRSGEDVSPNPRNDGILPIDHRGSCSAVHTVHS
jgi:hypothetical protein